MSEEEKKAIKQVKMRLEPNKYGGVCALGYNSSYCFGKKDIQALETVLNLIEKQDKMIDLMAKSMKENLCDADKMYICNGFTYEIKTCACMNENENCIQKIKEQFRKKVENNER